ncbi:MAG: hypothetical protein DYG89_11705 [Caldilinea sp. CFX5]|nr:hypothetical protein [Caldilinea sp. CFX5]
MEIRLRALRYPALASVVIVILAIGVNFLHWQAPRLTAEEQPTRTLRPLLETNAFPTTPPIGRPTLPVIDITFHDESAMWDWQWKLTCEPTLEVYLGQRYPLHAVSLTLVDDPTISLGVAYPDMGTPSAVALASCEEADGALTCRAAVGYGEAGAPLDLVATVAPVYAIQEALRAKDRQTWESQPAWDWSAFTPLIEQTEAGWQSQCVTLSPA